MEKEIYKLQEEIGCESSAVWLKEESGEFLFPYIFLGSHSLALENIQVPVHQGLCGYCIKTREAFISNDLANDKRFYDNADKITQYQSKNTICLPIVIYDECIGCVQLLNKDIGFTQADMDIGWEMVSYLIDNF